MDKIDNFHDIISDLPEGFKPISPEPEIKAEPNIESDKPTDLSLYRDRDQFHSDKGSPKRKHGDDDKVLNELDENSNTVNELDPNSVSMKHSPAKIVRENVEGNAFPCDFNSAFDLHQNGHIDAKTFPPMTTNMNQLNVIQTPAASTVEDPNSSISNEAEDIVRKLCKNGKVMEFQEGEDFIKVIVYEDSEEDSDKENNPRLMNKQRGNILTQPGSSTVSEQSFCPPAQMMLNPTSGPGMTGLPLEKQLLHHTPHPRNGYMFYNHDGTPTMADESVPGIKPRKSVPSTSTPCSQMNFGLGTTPVSSRTNIPLNSSGEENTSPVETMHTPTSQQLQNRVRSLINLPSYQFIDDNGKIREQHNQKERRRRARIKEACNLLRQLVPGMSDKTDKATVFEFAARYVHFLKSHTGAQFDKDFLMKYSPY